MSKRPHTRYDQSRRRAKGKGRDTWDGPLGVRAQQLRSQLFAEIDQAIGRGGAEARADAVAETVRQQRRIMGLSPPGPTTDDLAAVARREAQIIRAVSGVPPEAMGDIPIHGLARADAPTTDVTAEEIRADMEAALHILTTSSVLAPVEWPDPPYMDPGAPHDPEVSR